MKPNTIFAKLVRKEWLAKGALEINLRRPTTLDFVPGQFMRFHQNEVQRDYSLISRPDAETMDFCIAVVEDGIFSNRVSNASVGDWFELSGPHGRFIYHESDRPAVFVATGTGIAPFVSYCRSQPVHKAILLHGATTAAYLFYGETIEKCVNRYIPCIRRVENGEESDRRAYSGRVTDYLNRSLAKGTYDFYLCGRSAMIRDAVRIIDNRFEDSRLYIECYD